MKKNNYLGIGLALIFLAVAVVVLIDLLGFLSSNNFLGQYWPLLFILLGLFTFSAGSSRENGFAFGIIILGLLMLLFELNAFQTTAGKTILVLLLALSGLAVLVFAISKKPQEPKNKDR
jgi:hypothetical protein